MCMFEMLSNCNIDHMYMNAKTILTMLSKITSAMAAIDAGTIPGKFKLWIYKYYLVPIFSFILSSNILSQTSISIIQRKSTRFIKKKFNIPKCCSLAAIFHPNTLKIPHLKSYIDSKARVQLLALTTYRRPPCKGKRPCYELIPDVPRALWNSRKRNLVSIDTKKGSVQ